jgi:hypothetical protein
MKAYRDFDVIFVKGTSSLSPVVVPVQWKSGQCLKEGRRGKECARFLVFL